ncbi:hypothetical protein SteCoe_3226 [Stentor coeruleus]|uniref:alpha-1,2-Mannosidase n=1 Tax=Stentor coeruleus TaxID=5963 RepID=A0A1R2CXP2_9CILI|nr:hypothetical protein SteCoe_3226 [Stentor coeruleus]
MLSYFIMLILAAQAKNLPKELQALLKLSSDGDYSNKVTCKKPSVKTMVQLWEGHPNECIHEDSNSYLSIQYEKYLADKRLEFHSELIDVWAVIEDKALDQDLWNPVTGIGYSEKSSSSRLAIMNLDSVCLLGEKDQYNRTAEYILKLNLHEQGVIDVYDMVTQEIGALLSTFYLSKDKNILEKAKTAGEFLLKMYENWYPYSSYDVNKAQGFYDTISIKHILNLNEIYVLHFHTGDSRYMTIISQVISNIEDLLKYEVLPQYAIVKNNKLKYSGSITSDSSSAEVARILWNNWILSNKTANIFKDLYEKTKAYTIKKLPYTNDQGEILLVERNGDDIKYKMHLKMCAWAGVLGQESLVNFNMTLLKFSHKLLTSCFKFFTGGNLPADYLYLSANKITMEDKYFSIPSEIFESAYYMQKATSDGNFRKVVSFAFSSIKAKLKRKYGFTILGKDMMPEDFLSKTLKYLMLIYSDNRLVRALMTTTGHFLGYH